MRPFYCLGLGAFLLIFAFNGCNKMPNGGVPIYMKIDSVRVMDRSNQYMANAITDVWVEANADNVGAFGLPCNFPVLQANDVRFVVSAGIKESGQSGIRVIYPFYSTDTFTLTGAQLGSQYSRSPVFRYIDATVFSINDNFNLSSDFSGDTVITIGAGNRCGALTVTTIDSNKTMYTPALTLPAGQEIWLEFDYKSDVPFYTGFYANITSQAPIRAPVLFLNAKADWNHTYVKLSNYVGEAKADSYNIFFEALRPYGTSGGTLYIDNVKLVHF